jgi:hypothetical protein
MFETTVRHAAQVDDLLPGLAGFGVDADVDAAELLAQLGSLERLKAAVAAAQARVTARVADSAESDRGVAAQVALARRISPWQGAREVSFARSLATEYPATAAALAAGVLSERRAWIIVRDSAHLCPADRTALDAEVCADRAALGRLGDRGLTRLVRATAFRLDPYAGLDRSRDAAAGRHVSMRPLPDSMCRVSALLPLAQGVAVCASLGQAADTARAAGDERGRGQVQADTLVERVTGQAKASDVSVEVQVVLTDAALLGTGPGAEDPAQVPGYGSVPAGWVRDLITADLRRDADPTTAAAQVWLRRLYATPDFGTLVAMESSRRLFSAGLRRYLIARDGTCRTPWCDAPIRHLDHVEDHVRGGPTSDANGEGLCERCNHTKTLPGWQVSVVRDRAGPHTVRWRTPTGATYDSTAPPLLPGATPRTDSGARADFSVLEHTIEVALAA